MRWTLWSEGALAERTRELARSPDDRVDKAERVQRVAQIEHLDRGVGIAARNGDRGGGNATRRAITRALGT